MGVGDEAIHPVHNLLQRSDLTLGVVGRRYGNRCGRSRRRLDHQICSRRLRGRLRRDRAVALALLPLSGAARCLLSFGDPIDCRNSIELAAMLVQHLSPIASSLFSLLAIACLLLSFVMLGSRWLNNYLYAFAAESWIIAVLSAAVGFYGNYPELYLIAILTLLFRGLLLPYLV